MQAGQIADNTSWIATVVGVVAVRRSVRHTACHAAA